MREREEAPPSPCFSQVFILKGVKVLCFDTLLQVFILNDLGVHGKWLGSPFEAQAAAEMGVLARVG
jgi:hypothetical protein